MGVTAPKDRAITAGEPLPDESLPHFSGAALWAVGLLLALANFVAVLDMTISNVSVPTIAGSLGASLSQGTWVITSYAVAEAITVPLTGWLAARFGEGRVFAAALLAFAATSLLCGLSPSIQVLVGWRVAQGLCGAPLMPISQTLILRLFPDKLQPAAIGMWSVTTLVAPVCGPIFGGALCDGFGWPAIFLVNVPVAVAAGLVSWRLLVAGRRHVAVRAPFDGVGLALLVTWVGALQMMLDLGKDRDWFESPLIVALAVATVLAFACFLIWELTAEHPIVDLKVLRHRGFTAAMAVMACALAGYFATNVLTPLWLQTDLGYTAAESGLALSAVGVLAVVSAPLISWLCGRMDGRPIAFAGVAWLMATSLLRGLANTDMTFWQVYGVLLLVGAAMPTFFLPLTILSMAAVEPSETAGASGLASFVRTVSSAFATSIVATRWENYATAYHADLVGRSPHLAQAVQTLSAAGLARPQALITINQLVDGQAVVLATNRLFWDTAMVFGLGLLLVLLIPRPTRQVAVMAGH